MSQSVPSVPRSDGNNVTSSPKGNPQYKYDFVINNWNEQELAFLIDSMKLVAKKCILASEIGECSSVPHLQCYVSLKKKQRITSLAKLPGLARASFRACRNESALIDYCRKDGKVLFELGFPETVVIADPMEGLTLAWWQIKINSLIAAPPDHRKIYWFWSNQGALGKTTFAKHLCITHDALYVSGKAADLKCAIAMAKVKPKIVIFGLPRDQEEAVSYSGLEQVKDGIFFSGKYESGMTLMNIPHVIVFANFAPVRESLSQDRWEVHNLDLDGEDL